MITYVTDKKFPDGRVIPKKFRCLDKYGQKWYSPTMSLIKNTLKYNVKGLIMLSKLRYFNIAIFTLLLSACGGGGSGKGSAPEQNNSPNAVISSAGLTAFSRHDFTLDATGSNDRDGNIVNYHWQQLDANTVELTDNSASKITFKTPVTTTQLLLSFRLTVTDNDGNKGSSTIDINVVPNIFDAKATFPIPTSRLKGDKVSVSGTLATSALDNIPTQVKVTVSTGATEVIADVSANGDWLAKDVPIDELYTSLTITASDQKFNRTSVSQLDVIKDNNSFTKAFMAFDKNNKNIVYAFSPGILSSRILKIDLASQETELILSIEGSENIFYSTRDIAFNSVSQTMYLLYDGYDDSAIYAIDINNPKLTVLSSSTIGSGPELPTQSITDLAVDSTTNSLYVIFRTQNRLYQIAGDSGERVIVSDNTMEDSGVPFSSPDRLIVDELNRIAYINNSGNLLSVDLTTGKRSLLTESSIREMAFDEINNEIFYSSDSYHLYRFNLATKETIAIPPLEKIKSTRPFSELHFDAHHQNFIINDFISYGGLTDTDTLYAINRETSTQTLLFQDRVNEGPYLGTPMLMTTDKNAEYAYIIDSSRPAILKFNLTNGQREILVDNFHIQNDALISFHSITLNEKEDLIYVHFSYFEEHNRVNKLIKIELNDQAASPPTTELTIADFDLSDLYIAGYSELGNALYAVNLTKNQILKVNLSTLTFEVIASDSICEGNAIESLIDLAYDKINNRLVILCKSDFSIPGAKVIAIDLDTNNRKTLLEQEPVAEALMDEINTITVDSLGKYAYIHGDYTLSKFNLETAEITKIASPSQGNGESLFGITSLVKSPNNNLIFALNNAFESIIAIDENTGDRVTIGK